MKIIKESINVGPHSMKNTKDVLSNIAKAVYVDRGQNHIE
jgi:UDP-N-acetylmuramyl pentapeptide synthase